MDVELILVPYDSGRRAERMGAGPLRLLEAGIADCLADAGAHVQVRHVHLDCAFTTECSAAFLLAHHVRDLVRAARDRTALPIVLAGNCSSAIGTVAALHDPQIFWFDAHADLNTPETTRSGFFDGMSLAVVLGRCWKELSEDLGLRAVPTSHVWLLGARDLDPAEQVYLAGTRIRWQREPDAAVQALRDAPGGDVAYVHIDLDVLDPEVGRANGFATPRGFRLPQLLDAIDAISSRYPLGALALTAYDPACDGDGAIASAALAIARHLATARTSD